MNKEKIFKKNLIFRVRKINNSYNLIANNDCYELNEVSLSIWEKINGRNSVGDIIMSISEEYDVPTVEIENDIINFIDNMAKAGTVIEQEY